MLSSLRRSRSSTERKNFDRYRRLIDSHKNRMQLFSEIVDLRAKRAKWESLGRVKRRCPRRLALFNPSRHFPPFCLHYRKPQRRRILFSKTRKERLQMLGRDVEKSRGGERRDAEANKSMDSPSLLLFCLLPSHVFPPVLSLLKSK